MKGREPKKSQCWWVKENAMPPRPKVYAQDLDAGKYVNISRLDPEEKKLLWQDNKDNEPFVALVKDEFVQSLMTMFNAELAVEKSILNRPTKKVIRVVESFEPKYR